MQSLLLISHGSRQASSNEEIRRLERSLRQQLADHFPIVESAFLTFEEQSIDNAVVKCVEQGATSIKVLPYFLAAGVHVSQDIPDAVQLACKKHYALSVEILPHLGSSQRITSLISHLTTEQPYET